MRFGDSKPVKTESRLLHFSQQVDYMMNIDGEEEERMFPPIKGVLHLEGSGGVLTPRDGAGKKAVKKGLPASAKGPVRQMAVLRDRPLSTKAFHAVAANDHELKMFEKHALVRRMPLTEEAEKWLTDKEKERVKLFEDKVKKLKEDFAAKADKGKKDGKKDEKKDPKKKNTAPEDIPKLKPKYKSAREFMAVHFPIFDAINQSSGSAGPMRSQQISECARIVDAFEAVGYGIDKDVVHRALIIPQDRPESLCLENLREGPEGLMLNPLPKEMWRKEVKGGGGKKKGKKGKKKK